MTELTDILAARDTRDRPADADISIEEVERVLLERLDLIERGVPIPGVNAPAEVATETPPPRLTAPGWTVERQRAFIEHLASEGCVSHAARAVGLSKQSAYQLRDRGPNSLFALAWDVAIQRSRRILLDRATERALAGEERPIYHRGQEVGTRTVHNDRLLMFLIALKREPVHPNLSDHELAELWPTMLDQIDAVLPPMLGEERVGELTGS